MERHSTISQLRTILWQGKRCPRYIHIGQLQDHSPLVGIEFSSCFAQRVDPSLSNPFFPFRLFKQLPVLFDETKRRLIEE
jgi:hypothetical protein